MRKVGKSRGQVLRRLNIMGDLIPSTPNKSFFGLARGDEYYQRFGRD